MVARVAHPEPIVETEWVAENLGDPNLAVVDVHLDHGRLSYDSLGGYLDGGIEAWIEARLPVGSLETRIPAELYEHMETGERPEIVDVRFVAE